MTIISYIPPLHVGRKWVEYKGLMHTHPLTQLL